MRKAIAISILSCLLPLAALATDFSDLGGEISELRSAESPRVFAVNERHTIRIRKGVVTQIDGTAARARIKASRSRPVLKLGDTGSWLEFAVDADNMVMQPITTTGEADATRPFQLVQTHELKAFPDTEWPKFTAYAIQHGLAGYSARRIDGKPTSELLFYPRSYGSINTGSRSVMLTAQFNQQMSVSRKYPSVAGARGFVILLHDPHQNVAGRFQTLSGLQQLLQANDARNFQFLVEGRYDDPQRNIGLTELDQQLPVDGPSTPAVVHTLLSKFVINVPLACRLLYARGLPAYAIDDNRYLTYEASGEPPDAARLERTLGTLLRNLETAPQGLQATREKQELEESIIDNLVFLEADTSEIGDVALVDYFKTVADDLRATSRLASAMRSRGLVAAEAELADFVTAAGWFDRERKAYSNAIKRNSTMIDQIVNRVSGSSLVSIAFIGSFHTHAITEALRAKGIGYVVIEAHDFSGATEAESDLFDKANLGGTRDAFLDSLRLNMGYTSPSAQEVARLAPRMRTLTRSVDGQAGSLRQGLARIPNNKVDADRLLGAMNLNAGLSSASGAGGGAPPVPPRYDGAFAFFEPDRDGNAHGGALMLLNPADDRWRDRGRYDFLSLALFKAPERKRENAQSSLVLFYNDRETHRSYSTVYDPVSGRIYAFESSPAQMASFVPPPGGKSSNDGFIRIQVVETQPALENDDV